MLPLHTIEISELTLFAQNARCLANLRKIASALSDSRRRAGLRLGCAAAIEEKLGWVSSQVLRGGFKQRYDWIERRILRNPTCGSELVNSLRLT